MPEGYNEVSLSIEGKGVATAYPVSYTHLEEMTGKKLDDKVTDAAMDELVTTGELNKSIDGDSQAVSYTHLDVYKRQICEGK